MPWIERWKQIVWHPPMRPGIWRRKLGGFLLSTQIRDLQKRRRTAQKTCPDITSVEEAQRELDALRLEHRDAMTGRRRSKLPFGLFAASVFQAKVAARDIKSAKGAEKWSTALQKHLIPQFGAIPCADLRHGEFAAWRVKLSERIATPERIPGEGKKAGKMVKNPVHFSPRTVNTLFSILRVITKRMCAELDLERDPSTGLENFDTTEHPTYTDEKPNALTGDEARSFMAKTRELYPQHYALEVLGLATGLRPSTLRPLRRKGPEADLDLARGILRVRRSNSKGDAVMLSTKTGRHQTIHLPPELTAILREQCALVEALEADGQKKSDLLFPSRLGGFRSRSGLDKPFKAVSTAIGLRHPVTPRAMRRTFNDLMRLAGIDAVVARSISGHATVGMQEHYSTAQVEEQRAGLAKVVRLVSSERRTA